MFPFLHSTQIYLCVFPPAPCGRRRFLAALSVVYRSNKPVKGLLPFLVPLVNAGIRKHFHKYKADFMVQNIIDVGFVYPFTSFSVIFSFLAIFQVLLWAFLIFHVF